MFIFIFCSSNFFFPVLIKTYSTQEYGGIGEYHYAVYKEYNNNNFCYMISEYFKNTNHVLYLHSTNSNVSISDINLCLNLSHLVNWSINENMSVNYIQDNYRSIEYYMLSYDGCFDDNMSNCRTEIYFDNNDAARRLSFQNVLETAAIILIYCIGYFLVFYDIKSIALKQINKTVYLAKTLRTNPLYSTDISKEFREGHQYETEILEKALRKIGLLLQTSLGEAGASIIRNVLLGDGNLDMSRPGKKVTAVFGFIKIPRFIEVTECLQETVMPLVNELSDLVHNCVRRYNGSVNKNIGDSYLIVWKLDDEIDNKYLEHRNTGKMGAYKLGVGKDPKDLEEYLRNVTDNALSCFITLMTECRIQLFEKNSFIYKYSNHPSLKMKKWRFDLMYGLHIGWAIEGAIGSKHKIDASYLSPHVNIAARLEQATHQYGIDILFSDPFYSCLNEDVLLLLYIR